MLLDQDHLKAALGGVQKKLNFDTWKPFVEMAEREFRREVGAELYAHLSTVDADADLVSTARGCIAWTAYDKAIPHLKFSVGDLGIVKNAPQNSVAVAKWEYTDTREEIRIAVDQYFEDFFETLEALRPEVWTESDAYRQRRGLLIRSAGELSNYISLAGKNRRFFARLVEFIRRAEQFYIRPAITADVFDALKSTFQDATTTPTDAEAALIEKIRPALAYLATYEAMKYIPLSIEVSSLRTLRSMEPTRYEETNENERRAGIKTELYQDGQLYLADLKKHLDATASPTVFAPYYDAYLATTVKADNYDDFTNKSHVLF